MSDLDEYAKEHWKSVVLCKECKWYKDDYGNCPMLKLSWDDADSYDDEPRMQNNAKPDGWCYMGEKK